MAQSPNKPFPTTRFRSVRRLATLAVVTVLTFAGLALAAPQWMRNAGLDVWHFGSALKEHEVAHNRAEELRAASERQQQRSEACDHIASQVLAGILTLDEGAQEIEHIATHDPEWFETYRKHLHPGVTNSREVAALYLVAKIEGWHASASELGQSQRADALSDRLERLESELRMMAEPPDAVAMNR